MAGEKPIKDGYYWARKDNTWEWEVVQFKGGNTVFRHGDETYWDVDDFQDWGRQVRK